MAAAARARRRLAANAAGWPIQDIFLFLGLWARINTILCAPTLCLGTPTHPVIARTIAQYNAPPPPTPRYCNIYHTILAVAISCKGQPPLRELKRCPLRG